MFRFNAVCTIQCTWQGLLLAGLLLLLSACANVEQMSPSLVGGGNTPQDVVTSFVEDFNKALRDPQLDTRTRQNYWADLLASYFAPSERVDQRQNMAQALMTFAGGVDQLDADQKLVVEVTYSGIELSNQHDDRANIRLVDGTLHLRIVRNSDQKTITDVQRPFDATIGQRDGTLPLVQLNGHWFLTEG